MAHLILPSGKKLEDLVQNARSLSGVFGDINGEVVVAPSPSAGGSTIPVPVPDPEENLNPFAANETYDNDLDVSLVGGATYGPETAGNEAIVGTTKESHMVTFEGNIHNMQPFKTSLFTVN